MAVPMAPQQGSLFAAPAPIHLPDATLTHEPGFFTAERADALFADLLESTPWRRHEVVMWGKRMPVPRLSAWVGEPDRTYTYTGLRMEPEPWTAAVDHVRGAVERRLGLHFDSVLLNLYRDGHDSVAWHSDDEPELGPSPTIASVTFGAERVFRMRHRTLPDLRWEQALGHGSLLVMAGATQRCWHHQVPKTRRPVGPRINLTFRQIHR